MLLFTSLETNGGGGPPPPDPYADAVLALDFARALYSVGGIATPVGDMIDKPEFISDGSLQLRYIGIDPNDDIVFIQNAALAAIVTDPQATFVFDWLGITAPPYIFNMQDDDFNSALFVQATTAGGDWWMYAEDLGVPAGPNQQERDLNDVANMFAGPATRHRVAMTRTDAGLRLSRDGMAVVHGVDVGTPGSPMTTMNVTLACFGQINVSGGGNLQQEFNLNSFVVWPTVDDSLLPALSAL